MNDRLAVRKAWERFIGVPGDEVYANTEMQTRIPGMNAGFAGLAAPIPQTDTDGSNRVSGEQAPFEDLPPAITRQWRSPVSILREQNAAVEIMPFPALAVTVTAGANDIVRRVTIPERAQLVYITATDPAVFISPHRFTLPLAATTADIDDSTRLTVGPYSLPINKWWHCYGVGQLYVGIGLSGKSASILMFEGFSPRV